MNESPLHDVPGGPAPVKYHRPWMGDNSHEERPQTSVIGGKTTLNTAESSKGFEKRFRAASAPQTSQPVMKVPVQTKMTHPGPRSYILNARNHGFNGPFTLAPSHATSLLRVPSRLPTDVRYVYPGTYFQPENAPAFRNHAPLVPCFVRSPLQSRRPHTFYRPPELPVYMNPMPTPATGFMPQIHHSLTAANPPASPHFVIMTQQLWRPLLDGLNNPSFRETGTISDVLRAPGRPYGELSRAKNAHIQSTYMLCKQKTKVKGKQSTQSRKRVSSMLSSEAPDNSIGPHLQSEAETGKSGGKSRPNLLAKKPRLSAKVLPVSNSVRDAYSRLSECANSSPETHGSKHTKVSRKQQLKGRFTLERDGLFTKVMPATSIVSKPETMEDREAAIAVKSILDDCAEVDQPNCQSNDGSMSGEVSFDVNQNPLIQQIIECTRPCSVVLERLNEKVGKRHRRKKVLMFEPVLSQDVESKTVEASLFDKSRPAVKRIQGRVIKVNDGGGTTDMELRSMSMKRGHRLRKFGGASVNKQPKCSLGCCYGANRLQFTSPSWNHSNQSKTHRKIIPRKSHIVSGKGVKQATLQRDSSINPSSKMTHSTPRIPRKKIPRKLHDEPVCLDTAENQTMTSLQRVASASNDRDGIPKPLFKFITGVDARLKKQRAHCRSLLTCQYCHMYECTTNRMYRLSGHIQREHPFRCYRCKLVFASKADADDHKDRRHVTEKHHCIVCEKVFTSRKVHEKHEKSKVHLWNIEIQRKAIDVFLHSVRGDNESEDTVPNQYDIKHYYYQNPELEKFVCNMKSDVVAGTCTSQESHNEDTVSISDISLNTSGDVTSGLLDWLLDNENLQEVTSNTDAKTEYERALEAIAVDMTEGDSERDKDITFPANNSTKEILELVDRVNEPDAARENWQGDDTKTSDDNVLQSPQHSTPTTAGLNVGGTSSTDVHDDSVSASSNVLDEAFIHEISTSSFSPVGAMFAELTSTNVEEQHSSEPLARSESFESTDILLDEICQNSPAEPVATVGNATVGNTSLSAVLDVREEETSGTSAGQSAEVKGGHLCPDVMKMGSDDYYDVGTSEIIESIMNRDVTFREDVCSEPKDQSNQPGMKDGTNTFASGEDYVTARTEMDAPPHDDVSQLSCSFVSIPLDAKLTEPTDDDIEEMLLLL